MNILNALGLTIAMLVLIATIGVIVNATYNATNRKQQIMLAAGLAILYTICYIAVTG